MMDDPVPTVTTRVVFDRRNGKILYAYRSITLPGGTPPTDKQLDLMALNCGAQRTGAAHTQLGVMIVDDTQVKRGERYRVDVKTKRLVLSEAE
jgi:hypothetical protein